MFSASLRMAANIPSKVRIAFVEEVRTHPDFTLPFCCLVKSHRNHS